MATRSEELSPLENPLVLHYIFERCFVKDLKSCRLVSRLWRDASGTAWKTSAVARISSGIAGRRMSDFQLFSRDYGRNQEQIQENPFTNFRLHAVYSGWFYSNWGSSVKFLKLEVVTFESGQAFLNAIFNCCLNLEKLTLVGVTVVKTKAAVDWDTIQGNKKIKSLTILGVFRWKGVVWIEILNRVPSLQDFTLISSVSNCSGLFEALREIREHDPKNLNLKWLYIHRPYLTIEGASPSEAIFPVILDPRLQLESLQLHGIPLPDFSNSLSKIFKNNGSSLKKLVLENVMGDNAFIDGFDNPFRLSSQKQLENLQELNIVYQNQVYPVVNFLKLAPNLRKLVYWSPSATLLGVDASDVQDIKLKYCSELELVVTFLTPQDLEHFIRWMPSLKKLEIHELDNEMFSMVCHGWSKLESLDIRNSRMGDSAITGLDDEDVARFNENGETGVWRPVTVPRANITCMKDLRRLNLSADPLAPALRRSLGYCAVACGLELLPNLKYLSLYSFNLSRQAKAFLRKCAPNP